MVIKAVDESSSIASWDLRIDPMRKRDLVRIQEIEKLVYPKPWSVGIFLSELAHHKERSYSVAVHEDLVVGYSGVMYVLEDAHITNIAVDPSFQRGNIGSALMYALVMEAVEFGSKNMTLEVRVSNNAAQRLYQTFGFMPVGVRKGYYQENNEDAIIMWVYDIDLGGYRDRLMSLAGQRGLTARRRRHRWPRL